MAILVTGGAGYIGSHTAKALAAAGLDPIVFDNLSTGHREFCRWGPLVEADLGDRDALRAVLKKYPIDGVLHFAAHALVGESMTNPGKYFRNNSVNSLNLLDAMVEAGVRRIVFSSTCATYGEPQRIPIDEAHPQRPVNPYGESKLFTERALDWYSRAYGLRWVALRYFNAAGADADGEIGEDHDPETHLIPLVLAALVGRRKAVQIYGTDYPTVDGTAVRDYIHVTDLADAHLAALTYAEGHEGGVALNLGTGEGLSVREAIASAERVTGRRAPVEIAGRRAGDPPVLVADPSRARRALAWTPRCSDPDTILRTAWNWHSKRALEPARP
ncbi:MAG: UDP-glucose 4-epimerase GalE [Bryobacteraceae bacterium]